MAVRGGGVYDEAKKSIRFNAHLFDQDDAPVDVTGRTGARLTINIPVSDSSDPAKITSIVQRCVEGAFRSPVKPRKVALRARHPRNLLLKIPRRRR